MAGYLAWKKLEALEAKTSKERFVDLAVRYRLLNDDATVGGLLSDASGRPIISGWRWDRIGGCWARASADDIFCHEYTVQKQQVPIIVETTPDVIQVGMLAGRQAGKTHCGMLEIIKEALRWPGRDSAVISRDYKASREPEEVFRSMLHPSWNIRECKSDRIYTFPHGHKVFFRSREAIDSVRGPSLKTILLDEFALYQEEDYMTAVGCGAASRDFRLIFATTPRREVVWFRELVEKWKKREKSKVFVLRTYDNPRRNEAVIDEIKANTPADLYNQEFEGELVRPRHATYYLFDAARHIRPKPQTGDITRDFCREHFGEPANSIGGWDFAREATVVAKVFRDAHEVTIGRRSRIIRTEYLWIVGEVVDENSTTEHVAERVANTFGRNICWVTDAMGAYDRCGGRGTNDEAAAITILRSTGFTAVEPVARSNPNVEFRIRHVLRMLHSVQTWPWCPDGETRLYLEPGRTPRLKDALESHKRDRRTGRPEKDGYHEHVLDALGYLIFYCFPIEDLERDKEIDRTEIEESTPLILED